MTGNRSDREFDIVLVSSKDGSVVRNLTSGFDQDMGFEYIAIPGSRWNTVPWMSWSPSGDRLAYFVRTGGLPHAHRPERRDGTDRAADADEGRSTRPSRRRFSPDGRQVVFSALRDAKGDIFTVDLDSREVTNLTNDDFADYAPGLLARRHVRSSTWRA